MEMEREIPKVIHYCWFGGKPLPELARKCIASWKKFLPDFEIKEWNESNFDVYRTKFTREAYWLRHYAHVSDYARFWILYHYGGIYFDTDVELIRPMDDIIAKGTFMGFECQEGTPADNPEGNVNPGLGMGVYPGHPFLRQVLDYYDQAHFARWNGKITANVTLLTTRFLDFSKKERLDGGIIRANGMLIYPEEYFCPVNYYTKETKMSSNTRTIHHYMASWTTPGGSLRNLKERLRFILTRLRSTLCLMLCAGFLLLPGCTPREAISEYERINQAFTDAIGGDVSPLQWWRTTVRVNVNLPAGVPARLWLTSRSNDGVIYDYKEYDGSGTVVMTAPQGNENPLYLSVYTERGLTIESVPLSGKPEETINVSIDQGRSRGAESKAGTTHPASLCGSSITGNPRYYEFNPEEMADYRSIMEFARSTTDAKLAGLNCDYELTSNGPFYITWVDGYEASQRSHILGYYYHTPGTYDDIVYQDICETHKWDYIDGLAKIQYQLDMDITIDGHQFLANEWYDANFDMNDGYGSTYSDNMDRIGDNAYNSQIVFNHYRDHISAFQGISFEISVPKGKRIGFYLRSVEEFFPEQWRRLRAQGIKPITDKESLFNGTCFSVEAWNVNANHRSFIYQSETMTWIGMEDNVVGGDNDCNDVVFGLIGDLHVEPPIDPIDGDSSFPWTLAFEDIHRGTDYDFNDAVIQLLPDYQEETCHVRVLAAGEKERLFLHYDGPDGDYNLGELHQLLMGDMDRKCINTLEAVASVPFAETQAVPWPSEFTMIKDAQRFYVEVKRGTCTDCSDAIMLASTPGKLPEAMLIAGEWRWPREGIPVYETYREFPYWAKDAARTRYWEWYKSPMAGTYVAY